MPLTPDRDTARELLRRALPPGTQLHTETRSRRRSLSGTTTTSVRVTLPEQTPFAPENLSALAAAATGNRYSRRDLAVRGSFGGLNPGMHLLSELSQAVHGSSTALSQAPQSAPPGLTPARHISTAPSASQARTR